MRIGIDFHSAEREGSGNCTYIRNLVETLVNTDSENEYILYTNKQNYPYYDKFKRYRNVTPQYIKFKNPFIRIPYLGLLTFKDNIDVLHMQYIAPPFYHGKLVLTVHDLAFLHYPECFRSFERIRSTALIPVNVRRADYVLTGSEFSKKDIIEKASISAEKIEVIYDGCDAIFKPVSEQLAIQQLQEKFGIKGKFILSVGRLDPRKNLLRLIKAFKQIKDEKKIPHSLMIVGKKEFMSSEIEKAVGGIEDDIILTGYVTTEMLPFLYSAADVFVYPSLFEGFGLPCLEAMSCGCPVVSSQNSSIPEVVGDAGILIDPYKVEDIAKAMYHVVSNNTLRNKMKEDGLRKAAKFSWAASAQKTLSVYKKAFGK